MFSLPPTSNPPLGEANILRREVWQQALLSQAADLFLTCLIPLTSRWPNHAICVCRQDRSNDHALRTSNLNLWTSFISKPSPPRASWLYFYHQLYWGLLLALHYSSYRNDPIMPSKSVNDSTPSQHGNLTISKRVTCLLQRPTTNRITTCTNSR